MVESWIVDPVVTGSIPVVHPTFMKTEARLPMEAGFSFSVLLAAVLMTGACYFSSSSFAWIAVKSGITRGSSEMLA